MSKMKMTLETRANIVCNKKIKKYEVMKMRTMMTSKKIAVKVSKTKADKKLTTMK